MKIIKDVRKKKALIERCIKKHGHFAEHNFMHYMNNEIAPESNVFFHAGNSKGILSQFNPKDSSWSLFPDSILAPEFARNELFEEFLEHVLLRENGSRVIVEVTEPFKDYIVEKLKDHKKFRECRNHFILYWPVYNLKNLDMKLKGGKWKKLRNIKNRFYRMSRVRAVPSQRVDKEKLKEIVRQWVKRRSGSDTAHEEYYFNLVDNNFKGTDFARTLLVNGRPCTITAGWKIPNSDCYYSAVGIYDYSHKDLGVVTNFDDLKNLKRKGMKYVDFGGSDKALLQFKKKFKPDHIYKTYLFSIVRK
ncbi:hypothetical protein J4212_05940 [Candidatus Woesearchaeota archaeon]|nr:hypothetical protein [Candidatus Woesearchaeota archaeon]